MVRARIRTRPPRVRNIGSNNDVSTSLLLPPRVGTLGWPVFYLEHRTLELMQSGISAVQLLKGLRLGMLLKGLQVGTRLHSKIGIRTWD